MTAQGATMLAYLIAAICFILALRGLSSPETARRGNVYGMAGMALAVVTTLFSPVVETYVWIILAIIIGGAIGTVVVDLLRDVSVGVIRACQGPLRLAIGPPVADLDAGSGIRRRSLPTGRPTAALNWGAFQLRLLDRALTGSASQSDSAGHERRPNCQRECSFHPH